jgi:phosphate transport system substrate-binding protein
MLFVGLLTALGEPAESSIELTGAGATFPQPFYEYAFNRYPTTAPNLVVRYQGIGSGSGAASLLKREVDFAASDVVFSDEEHKRAADNIVQVPTCLGAVTVVVNLPGNPRIRLTPDTLAAMFLGRITRWNERDIVDLNPSATLQALPITVVHRSDSSGTSSIFTEYLSKTSSDWKAKVGTGREVAWPTGRSAKGNTGVAGLVRQVPGAIGYVELVYAIGNEMTMVAMRNRAGKFVIPTPESVSLAAAHLPENATMSLTDTPERDGYPISSFSWIVLYREQAYGSRVRGRAEALARLLWWLVHDGQKYAAELNYAALPSAAIARAEAELRSISFQGIPILPEVPAPKRPVPGAAR